MNCASLFIQLNRIYRCSDNHWGWFVGTTLAELALTAKAAPTNQNHFLKSYRQTSLLLHHSLSSKTLSSETQPEPADVST